MNFNVNFIVLLSKYIVHPLVKIKKKTLIISRCSVKLWKKLNMFYLNNKLKHREKTDFALRQKGQYSSL